MCCAAWEFMSTSHMDLPYIRVQCAQILNHIACSKEHHQSRCFWLSKGAKSFFWKALVVEILLMFDFCWCSSSFRLKLIVVSKTPNSLLYTEPAIISMVFLSLLLLSTLRLKLQLFIRDHAAKLKPWKHESSKAKVVRIKWRGKTSATAKDISNLKESFSSLKHKKHHLNTKRRICCHSENATSPKSHKPFSVPTTKSPLISGQP